LVNAVYLFSDYVTCQKLLNKSLGKSPKNRMREMKTQKKKKMCPKATLRQHSGEMSWDFLFVFLVRNFFSLCSSSPPLNLLLLLLAAHLRRFGFPFFLLLLFAAEKIIKFTYKPETYTYLSIYTTSIYIKMNMCLLRYL